MSKAKNSKEEDVVDDEYDNEEDFYDDDEENVQKGEPVSEEQRSYAIGKFFDVSNYLYEKEMNYKGYTKRAGKYVKTGDEIAPDLFIDSIISTYRSVLAQHSTISYLSDNEANDLLLEKFNACMQTIIEEPFFDWSRFQLFKEDYDHTLQLFVGLIRRGRGSQVAMNLQAGMVSQDINQDPNKNKKFTEEMMDYITKRGKN